MNSDHIFAQNWRTIDVRLEQFLLVNEYGPFLQKRHPANAYAAESGRAAFGSAWLLPALERLRRASLHPRKLPSSTSTDGWSDRRTNSAAKRNHSVWSLIAGPESSESD